MLEKSFRAPFLTSSADHNWNIVNSWTHSELDQSSIRSFLRTTEWLHPIIALWLSLTVEIADYTYSGLSLTELAQSKPTLDSSWKSWLRTSLSWNSSCQSRLRAGLLWDNPWQRRLRAGFLCENSLPSGFRAGLFWDSSWQRGLTAGFLWENSLPSGFRAGLFWDNSWQSWLGVGFLWDNAWQSWLGDALIWVYPWKSCRRLGKHCVYSSQKTWSWRKRNKFCSSFIIISLECFICFHFPSTLSFC